MTDFLLELRSEEVPARMQAGARAELEKLFRKEMDAAGVLRQAQDQPEIVVWSTPRRLALIARDLPEATAAVSEELKGPKVGAPPQALEGFLRKTGLSQDQLTERDGIYFAVTEKPGRATAEVLAEAIPAIVRAFAWPKSMRWGAASLSTESPRWVRPLSGIVAIFGEELVNCTVGDVRSGFATKGHRFHCPGEITIGSASDYQEKLRACHVIVDHEERQNAIRSGAKAVAEAAGLVLVEDEGLVIENAGLTEWPVPLLGRFDEAFLEVPPEVIQLTARTNQKYFVCNDAAGKLANAFVCTANIAASDGGAEIVAGNRKVLAARLSDARFFWEQDRKKTLEQHAEGLARITFHEKLGTVADKVERVAKLARWLVEEGIVGSNPTPATKHSVRPEPVEGPGAAQGASTSSARTDLGLADLAEQAARLCKADLTTEMVGEFPELQGLMGGYYARAEGLDPQVADAIANHYSAKARAPLNPVWLSLGLADRIDTLNSFFSINALPTGSKDPFALRRAAIETLFLTGLADNQFDLSKCAREDVVDFIVERWINQAKQGDARPDTLQAIVTSRADGRIRVMAARWRALVAFLETEDGANLLAGYKRAANILKKEGYDSPTPPTVIPANAGTKGGPTLGPRVRGDDGNRDGNDGSKSGDDEVGEKTLSYIPEPAEKALIDALDLAAPLAATAVAEERFADAMAALASLRAAVDAFFESVTVNDSDPAKRDARLALLARFRNAVHAVADFSKIEG